MIKNNLKVLLIEDNPGDAILIKEHLLDVTDFNFDLEVASRLSEGIKLILQDQFDIILTDLGLPDSHGLDTLNMLVNQDQNLPIIVLTGLDDERIGIEAVQKGAQDYLVKGTVDGNVLTRSMRYAIERKKMADELTRYAEHLEEEVKLRTNELIQSEKMASLGQLVAGVAHEVNNPLAYLNSNTEIIDEQIQVLKKSCKENVTLEVLNEITNLLDINIKGIDRIATITKSLKRFAMPNTEDRILADLNQGLKDTLLILHNKLKHHIIVHEELGEIPEVECNIGLLNQVFMNLILNASQAIEKGDIWIKTWSDKDNVFIEIKDNGHGIPEEILTRIFDPFFTTKKEGTGLGLSLCYRIIKDHKGDVKVNSNLDVGTEFLIRIPKEGQGC